MKPSGFYTYTLGANASVNLPVTGDYFKIMSATGLVSVKSDFGSLDDLIAGQGLENTPFRFLTIVNRTAASNTVRLFVGDENFIDGVSGTIAITATVAARTAFVQTAATVTNVAANAVAASTTRNYILIQNRDLTGNVFVNFATTATVATGIKIPPGGFYESGTVCPTGAASCIGDIASNTNVLVVTG